MVVVVGGYGEGAFEEEREDAEKEMKLKRGGLKEKQPVSSLKIHGTNVDLTSLNHQLSSKNNPLFLHSKR